MMRSCSFKAKWTWWLALAFRAGAGVCLLQTSCGLAAGPEAGAPPAPGGRVNQGECSEDGDCPDGFCDSSGVCSAVDVAIGYGKVCPFAAGAASASACGGYFCMDGRCRSCRSDRECQVATGLDHLQCRRFFGWPGNRCTPPGQDSLPPITSPGVVLPYRESHVVVLRTYPHAVDAFTQGLLYSDGWLFESTGLNGSSSLRRVELETGRVDKKVLLPADVFAEGLAAVGDVLIQLSYEGGRAFLWDKISFAPLGELAYSGQGWGLCYNGSHLVMSDGTDVLQVRDPQTFQVLSLVPVRKRGLPVANLNELECVGGDVYANIWQQRHIARIELKTGRVTDWIHAGYLLKHAGEGRDVSMADVLNGIAYIPERDRFLLTGKRWPAVFEVELRPLLDR
jgi:glutaminyl-peptide cyclotransferase